MTGQGAALAHRDGIRVSVEVRTVNSRYYKLSLRTTEGYATLEPRIEEVLRGVIRRGTVQADVRIEREAAADQFRINASVLAAYLAQIQSLAENLRVKQEIRLDSLLALPGVAEEHLLDGGDSEECWPVVEQALKESLSRLTQMRSEEGRAMAVDLRANCDTILSELDHIEQLAPTVVEGYRQRLTDRLNRLLGEYNVVVQPSDVIREVGVFAERSDISEEIVRLRSHLEQFISIMDLPAAEGRKLEFVTQEMFREANTIGSKSNDAEISRRVIEIKTAVERIREMIQNVE